MGVFQVGAEQGNSCVNFHLIGLSLLECQHFGQESGPAAQLTYVQVCEPQGNPAAVYPIQSNGSIQWLPSEPTPQPWAEPAPQRLETNLTILAVEEEIEDDDPYPFDPDWGPPPPPWIPWSNSDRACLTDVTQALQERQAHFDFGFLLDPIRSFINKAPSGYLLVEGKSGAGKSYLGTYLQAMAPQVHPSGIRVAYLKTARRPFGDYETFIESINDQLAVSNAPRTHRILPLDRMALHDLAVQYPSPMLQQRWTAFVSSLCGHHGGPILLYLDEIDRRHSGESSHVSPLDYLPDHLPDQVYIIVTYKPDASEAFLTQLKTTAGSRAIQLTLPVTTDYLKQLDHDLTKIGALQGQSGVLQALLQANEFRLHYSRLACQAWVGHLIDSTGQTKFTDLYPTIFNNLRSQRPDRFASLQRFLMTVCAAFEPIAWEDLEEWGTSIETMKEIVDLIPAALVQQKLSMFLSTVGSRVDIAHESLRDFLIHQDQEAFASVCRALTGWAVNKIQTSGDLKLNDEEGREWARHTFYGLYSWSLLCQDVSVLEWVVRNKDLQRKRIAISQALETSARPHQKLGLLDLWVEALRILVEEHQRDDLSDELAWALNSRGLTWLTLHRRQRALADLDQSLKLFDNLVYKEGKTQFLNGLAAAYNRRSEMHFAMHQLDKALSDSAQAVLLFTDLVEDLGREDLLPLLAFAHRNQSQVWAATGNVCQASSSMEAALTVFQQLSVGGHEGPYTQELATCHLQLARQRQKSHQHLESLQESDKAVALLSQLSEGDSTTDLRDLLEQSHFARGASYLAIEQPGKAMCDFTHSIRLSTQLLKEGRLDQRDELARAYSARSKAQLHSGLPEEAIGDLGKSIEFRQILISEGRRDQGLEVALAYIQRAELFRVDGQKEACQTDLSGALSILVTLSLAGDDVADLLRTVHRQRAVLGMDSGNYGEVVYDADQALQLLQAGKNENPEEEAQLLFLRGEGYRCKRQSAKARADFEACIQVFTELLHAKGETSHLVDVAVAYGKLSRVSLLSGHLDRAHQEVNRSVEALEVSVQEAEAGDRWANLAQAYSTRAEVLERQAQHQAAQRDLTRSLAIYSKLVESEGKQHLLDEQALAYRRLGRTLLSLKEVNPALNALEEASKRYQELWSKDRRGPWLDELRRTQVVRSAVSVVLKEYKVAEEEIQRSQEHFSKLLDQGNPEYFDDLFQVSMQRLNNLVSLGLDAKAKAEMESLFELLKRTSEQFDGVDFRLPLAQLLQSKAGVLASQKSYEQAYDDLETAILTLQPLVFEENQLDLGRNLADIYRQRARMLLAGGILQAGLADLSQAARVLSFLLSQGREYLRRPLAEVAQERATAHLSQNELVAAVEDLNLGVELLTSVTGYSDDPDLARMLSQRGRCFQQAQQVELASQDFEKGCQIYARLVETQGRHDLTGILAGCLLCHLNLSGQSFDEPHRLQALVKAVRSVTQQALAGNPPEESLVLNAVMAVRKSLSINPYQGVPELLDSVTKLCGAVLQLPRISYDWVNLTELLSQCTMAMEAVKGPGYVPFICLSCVSCGREVGSLGAATVPRLIYFLTLLGVALSTEAPGEHLSLVGKVFTILLEQLAHQPLDEQQALSLHQLVTTWQRLPAGYPAAASVSRGVLTSLLRATRSQKS